MGMGSQPAPATPAPKPEIPVPQDKDPRGVEAARESQRRLEGRRGGSASGHLLAGVGGPDSDPQPTTKSLIGMY